MESEEARAISNQDFINNMVEAALRIGLIFILLVWSFGIIKPFVVPIVWGGIIAIALMPVTLRVKRWLGGRHAAAATLITLLGIAILLVPTIMVSQSLIGSSQQVAQALEKGDVQVPPPREEVADWPFIGESTYSFWTLASDNLEAALQRIEPQLRAFGTWLIGTIGAGALNVLMFIISLLIAGVFMAKSEAVEASAKRLFTRVVGEQGSDWADLSAATVRSVVQGVLGVAAIQALLAGIGLFLMDVPAYGIWIVLVLLLAIVQLPPILILGPIIIYVWSYADTTPALIFTIWCIIVSASDAFLKPLLLGRGLDVPMPVILLGAIGGMVASGVIGLFTGAVILAIWYKLFGLWLETSRA